MKYNIPGLVDIIRSENIPKRIGSNHVTPTLEGIKILVFESEEYAKKAAEDFRNNHYTPKTALNKLMMQSADDPLHCMFPFAGVEFNGEYGLMVLDKIGAEVNSYLISHR